MKYPLLALAALAVGVIATPAVVGADATKASVIPVEDFFAEPDLRNPQLSPDGKYLAFLTTLGTGKVGIALMDLGTGKVDALVAAKDENIKTYFWKGSEYIVYGGDIGGDESPAFRSIHVQKRSIVSLSEAYRELTREEANFFNLTDTLRFDPHHVVGFGRKTEGSFAFGMYTLDVRDGSRRLAPGYDPSKADGTTFLADNNGVLRLRSYFEGDKMVYDVRPQPTDPFVRVAAFPANEPKWDPQFFGADNETLYLLSTEHSDTNTLYTFNIRTRELSAPVFHDAAGEIESVLLSYDRTKLYGVAVNTDKLHFHFLDANRGKLAALIDHSLPNTENLVISVSADEKVMVILAHSDRDPGTYYVLDLIRGRLMPIGKVNHHIDPAKLAPMEPIQFTSRDGLTIHGYLTRPSGSEGKKVPLIIHPHGGPFGIRDDWGFNPDVQFLASRGFAVLQINYRGSGGYGYSFQKAGQREWGGKMQNDLSDGVQWAINQGITDAKHVGIYGASYGGYATLAGLTFTPELYRCGVNYVGVSDLSLITSWGTGSRSNRGMDQFYREWVGDDAQYKHDRSPVNFVDRIRAPLLNAYGFNDPRVEIRNWERLEAKLKEYGKTYEIVMMGDEGHGFRNEGNRIAFYQKLESFLLRYMLDENVTAKPLQVIEQPAK